jgi:hypothetical protein
MLYLTGAGVHRRRGGEAAGSVTSQRLRQNIYVLLDQAETLIHSPTDTVALKRCATQNPRVRNSTGAQNSKPRLLGGVLLIQFRTTALLLVARSG